MSCLVLKISSSFLTILLSASVALASGGEEGGKPADAKDAPKEVKPREESYGVVQARVAALEAKIRAGETEIQKLILEKQHTKDPAKVNEILQHMMTLHKDLAKNLKDYDKERTLLKYRYPEKGLADKREYERIDLKSIEEMENQMSLGSSVKRTLKKVRTQYEAPEDVKKVEASEAADGHKKSVPQAPASLTDPVILKK
ncbi:hypothetical protein Bb109J_c0247 [Bdellovibrio bacteriovorus]|uniref:hypothetical protein n=1 Tax=Bdellovibrio bacteriovorus TaxID=959 RepID=UPI00045C03E6|nr:hypothetical protein [Bdellovibrio bacteriovorus]AHZ85906.1 hypothetical protein EP01_13310 [Bdellovibrio bacteriovorus]BEV66827.1 hypothetical protein Bb109J_c0247 [Bdellovibrio bacteriovorus]